MKILDILNEDILSKIIQNSLKIYKNNPDQNIEDFYKNINEKDVEFLKKEKLLEKETAKTKMQVFHIAFKIISIILLKEFFIKKGLLITKIYNYLIKDNYIEEIEKIELLLKDKLKKLNKNEIKIIMETLYVDLTCLVSRKNTGTEFTPNEIVEYMLDCINYSGKEILEKKFLDPACGSGIYIIKALNRLCNDLDEIEIIKKLLIEKILIAYDINPVNVMMTKFLIIIELCEIKKNFKTDEIINIYSKFPVYCKNILFEKGKYDFIAGNPPYIRLQNISEQDRNIIENTFGSATGRYDLYVCFMEKLITMLENNGKISLITSNKYMTTNYGKGIRNFIKENLEVFELLDLSDTKYFKASVLPAIITGIKEKKPSNNNITYAHLKQDNSKLKKDENLKIANLKQLFELHHNNQNIKKYYFLKKGEELLKVEFVKSKEKLPEKNSAWNFGAKDDSDIKTYIENQQTLKLEEIADICVGIKTTVDDIYVKPMNFNFIKEKMFEKEVIYPLLQSHNIKKWKISWDSLNLKDKYIFYPHELHLGKMRAIDLEKFPNAKKYIYENQEILKNRKYLAESLTRQWYECWVPQSLDKFKKTKIITADIASSNSFAIDYTGKLCQGNTFFITLKEDQIETTLSLEKDHDKIYRNENKKNYWLYLLAILNSEVLEFYQKSISGSLYSKKFRYTTTNLKQWPIPKITKNNIKLVNEIINSICIIEKYYPNIKDIEIELQNKIYDLYNISTNYKNKIKKFLEVNS